MSQAVCVLFSIKNQGIGIKHTYWSVSLKWTLRNKSKDLWTHKYLLGSQKYTLKKLHLQKLCWWKKLASWIRIQIKLYLSSYTKLGSKWIKELNKRPDTENLIEKNVGNNLELYWTGKDFLNYKNNKILLTQALR